MYLYSEGLAHQYDSYLPWTANQTHEGGNFPSYKGDPQGARLTFDNPRYQEAKKRGYWYRNIDQKICCYQEEGDFLSISRGLMGSLMYLLHGNRLAYTIVDQRRSLPEIDLSFRGDLREYQTRAIARILKKHFGILVAPCGSGKKEMGLRIIAERKQPALVIVHRKEHCKVPASLLEKEGITCAVLTGDLPKRQREEAIKELEAGKLRVVLATGQLAGEGLDIPRLNRLFVTTRFDGRASLNNT